MLNLAHFLQLERPLAVLDLETTGFDPEKDRICQMGITIHYVHRDPIKWASFVNPERAIPNAHIHGVTDEHVSGAPTFRQIAPVLAPKITDVDIAGYNVTFDIGFLRAEMLRAGVTWNWNGKVVDAYQIYRKMYPHTLGNAYCEYGGENGEALPKGSKLEGAHDAGVDVTATEIVLRGQLLRHPELPRTVAALADVCFPPKPNAIDKEGKFIWREDGVPCIAFGKWARNGPLPMRDVERNYYKFICDNSFPPDVKEIAAAALMGIFPTKP